MECIVWIVIMGRTEMTSESWSESLQRHQPLISANHVHVCLPLNLQTLLDQCVQDLQPMDIDCFQSD